MRIILFDIDGTLILTDRAGQHALEDTMTTSTGTARPRGEFDFAGRTDRSIVADHLQHYGLADTTENFNRFSEDFLSRLPGSLAARQGFVLPGVLESLRRLDGRPDIHVGLLTGNLRRAARIKLAYFGLDSFFYSDGEPIGGFGDEHYDRDDVARHALNDIHQRFEDDIDPQQIWIVGDTPRDVKCARAIGARVLAVATGGYSIETLAATRPDLLVNDLASANPWWTELEQ